MTEQPKGFSTAREEPSESGDVEPMGPASPSSPASNAPSARPESGQEADGENVGFSSIASLERLRDRVEVASREMRRLREENRALADRIEELESRPAVDPHGAVLSLDHDPEVLKRKISGFIEAIDSYLEKERRRP